MAQIRHHYPLADGRHLLAVDVVGDLRVGDVAEVRSAGARRHVVIVAAEPGESGPSSLRRPVVEIDRAPGLLIVGPAGRVQGEICLVAVEIPRADRVAG